MVSQGSGFSILLGRPARRTARLRAPDVGRAAPCFASGQYLEAAGLAEEAAGADDLAFAARALLAHCMTGSAAPDARLVERAVKDAEAALRLDPQHGEGRLQLAIALSLKSRDMDVMAAWSAGYGERGKKLAEEVLKADPANFYAHGFLAVWNLEVARRGGGMGAWMLGASEASGRSHYENAALAPDDVGVHWQYARALAALDVKQYGVEASTVLGKALRRARTLMSRGSCRSAQPSLPRR